MTRANTRMKNIIQSISWPRGDGHLDFVPIQAVNAIVNDGRIGIKPTWSDVMRAMDPKWWPGCTPFLSDLVEKGFIKDDRPADPTPYFYQSPVGTVTGRMSSSNPNASQIPQDGIPHDLVRRVNDLQREMDLLRYDIVASIEAAKRGGYDGPN